MEISRNQNKNNDFFHDFSLIIFLKHKNVETYVLQNFTNMHFQSLEVLYRVCETQLQMIQSIKPFQAWINHCHLHPLEAANSCCDSRLIVDDDDLKWVTNEKKVAILLKIIPWKFSF